MSDHHKTVCRECKTVITQCRCPSLDKRVTEVVCDKCLRKPTKKAMVYVEAPNRPTTEFPRLFLAGGITGCPDWQSTMVELLKDSNYTLFNPRRKNFPIHDPDSAFEQIKWEHDMLRSADAILFWFPRETLCPIVLYELGAWSMTGKVIYVGMDPEYQRKQDVHFQTKFSRPDVQIVYTLRDLAAQVKGTDA